MFRKRSTMFTVPAVLILVLMWQLVQADAPSTSGQAAIPTTSHPAHAQVRQILPTLFQSQAEHVAGAYTPGMGATIILDLIRGPNSVPNQPSYVGTRDWAIYLMQTFGSQLTAVPADEQIAISVDFYDYHDVTFHQLVVSTPAATVGDPSAYTILLDGQPYAEATSQPGSAPSEGGNLVPPTTPAGGEVPAAQTTAMSTIMEPPGEVSLSFDFEDPQAAAQMWKPVPGMMWTFTDVDYAQTELGKFDLISILNQPVAGDYTFQADMKYIEGQMGGGLIFNAPTNDSKKGAHMISYTADGTFLQWGYFDENGDHQFQGGTSVESGADGQWHTLSVRVEDDQYDVTIDGKLVAENVPVVQPSPGYVGLLASTSHVLFDNVKLEGIQP